MNDIIKVLRINKYIQIDKGEVLLDGKRVICVTLNNTCAVEDEDTGEMPLTSEQLDHLFNQTFGLKEG
jgi:hypothetical protein